MPAVAGHRRGVAQANLPWDQAVAPPLTPGPVRLSRVDATDDDSLVARCQAGDGTAFRALFMQHRADVARHVYRLTGPSADAEDLVQEVFFQVHRSLKDFRGQARFTTWLHRVTVNVVLMSRRAAKSRPVFAAEVDADRHADGTRARPDEDAERNTRIREIGRAHV